MNNESGHTNPSNGLNNFHVLTTARNSIMHAAPLTDAPIDGPTSTGDKAVLPQVTDYTRKSIVINDRCDNDELPYEMRAHDSVMVHTSTDEQHKSLSNLMAEMTADALSMTVHERRLLDASIKAAWYLDKAMVVRAETHGTLSSPDPSILHARQAIASVNSKLILPAIDRINLAASSASIALSDAFSVAK